MDSIKKQEKNHSPKPQVKRFGEEIRQRTRCQQPKNLEV